MYLLLATLHYDNVNVIIQSSHNYTLFKVHVVHRYTGKRKQIYNRYLELQSA